MQCLELVLLDGFPLPINVVSMLSKGTWFFNSFSVALVVFQEWKTTLLTFEEDPEPYSKVRDASICALAREAGVDVVIRTSHTLYQLNK